MTLDEIRDKLKPYNIKEVAREINVPYQQLYRISAGTVKNPKIDVYLKLVKYLEGRWLTLKKQKKSYPKKK